MEYPIIHKDNLELYGITPYTQYRIDQEYIIFANKLTNSSIKLKVPQEIQKEVILFLANKHPQHIMHSALYHLYGNDWRNIIRVLFEYKIIE